MNNVVTLSVYDIARKNIRRQPLRSACIIITVLLFSFLLLTGSVLAISLSNGADSLANRLGADVMVVPSKAQPHIEAIFLASEPSRFYLPADTMNLLLNMDADIGIERITPQTFLSTLKASCCSYPVQVIGIDYDSDFLIKPWLKATLNHDLKDGEVILGHSANGEPGGEISLFGENLKIAGRLERTGMKFDASVFITRSTLEKLSVKSKRMRALNLHNSGNLDSAIMIKLSPGYDPELAALEINSRFALRGIHAFFTRKFVNTIGKNITFLSYFVMGIILLLWVLSVIVIFLLFSLSMNERQKEMGILRILGASRKKLKYIVLSEAFMISSFGALTGVILAGAVIAVFSPMVINTMHLPFMLPSFGELAFMIAGTLAVSIMTGVFSAHNAARRASGKDIHEVMR